MAWQYITQPKLVFYLVWPQACEHNCSRVRWVKAQCGFLPYSKTLPYHNNMTFWLILAVQVLARFTSQHLLFLQTFTSGMTELHIQGSFQTDCCSCRRFLLEWLSFTYIISHHLLFLQAFPSRMAELPVQIRASGAVGGCAPVHAVAPTSLLWQIRPGNPASQVLAFCLPISVPITCLLSSHHCSHQMSSVLLSVFSSHAFCLPINSLITCLLSSYQYSHHMPSVFLSVFSSHPFCLPVNVPITCLLSCY